MGSILDVGVPGQPLNTPPLTVWQKAVRDTLNGRDTTVDARISQAVSLGAPWQQWTPTYTGATYSSIKASYTSGAFVTMAVKATVNTVTGEITFSLPGNAHPDQVGTTIGTAKLFVAGGSYFAHVYLGTATTCAVRVAGANGLATAISATYPATWATGNTIQFNAHYAAP